MAEAGRREAGRGELSGGEAGERATDVAARRRALPVRWAFAAGRFWVDFLVGDTPELLVGAVVAVGIAAALVGAGQRAAAVAALPVLVVVVVGGSVWRAARRSG